MVRRRNTGTKHFIVVRQLTAEGNVKSEILEITKKIELYFVIASTYLGLECFYEQCSWERV